MGTIIVCDGGCGAQSPNPTTGLHTANRWPTVRIARHWRDNISAMHESNDLRFCEKCWKRVEAAMRPTPTQKDTKDG